MKKSSIFHRAHIRASVSILLVLLAFSGDTPLAQSHTGARRSLMEKNVEMRKNDGAAKKADSRDLIEIGGSCAQLEVHSPVDSPKCISHSSLVVPGELKIVSYNIRWRSGDELQEIARLLKSDKEIGGAGIIGLQEVDRKRKRSGHTNTARIIAESLGMNYAWAAPPLSKRQDMAQAKNKNKTNAAPEEETGVAILSSYPLTDVVKILLPHEGPGGRRRVAVGATAHTGSRLVRVYSVHAETRVTVDERTGQLKAVLDDLAKYPKELPAIVLGDFNSWQPDSKRDLINLFTAADFITPFPPGQPTFRHFLVKMRLDWIWLRRFAPAASYGIARHIKISDHYPLWLAVPVESGKR